MPLINNSLLQDESKLIPVHDWPKPVLNELVQSTASAYLRCPTPPLGSPSPDTLQQTNRNGAVPSYRVFQGY